MAATDLLFRNLANAATSTLFHDIHINLDQYNLGQGLLYLGIVVFEIPSQMVIQRVGPQKWLTFQVFCFGLVSTFQMFMKNNASFMVTRVLLGIVECGYIPGSLYMLSTFYKRSELSLRTSGFYLGLSLVTGCGGLFAAGLLGINNGSLKSWQYLFLIEGSLAIFCGFLFLALLPDSPSNPVPLLFPRLTLFSDREKEIIKARVIIDDKAKAEQTRALTAHEIFDTLLNWRNYPHLLHSLCCSAAGVGMGQYTPLIIKGLGFSTRKSNLLSSVGGWLMFIVMAVTGLISTYVPNKGYMVMALTTCSLILWAVFLTQANSTDHWAKYASMIVTTAFAMSWHPQNAAWLALNQKTPQQRAIAFAMFVMSANLGGFLGSQLLRASDAPKYYIGFRTCISLVAFSTLVVYLQHLQYRLSNRSNERKEAAGEPLNEERPTRYVI